MISKGCQLSSISSIISAAKFSNTLAASGSACLRQASQYHHVPRSLIQHRALQKRLFFSSVRALASPKRGSNSQQARQRSGAKKQITIPSFLSVANLANQLNVRYSSLVKALKNLGFDESQLGHDYILDCETASLIADEFGFEVNNNSQVKNDEKYDVFKSPLCTDATKLKPRPPIVTIMGHVDHGKTTILDYLRKSSIVKSEFGGITQHIGAFSVKTPISNKLITFLDTPGHAAFLKMRERGANITDIVVLVVAADDSVKPQTIEAIKHCQKYDTSVIVAINKCDKPGADPKKVLTDLSSHGLYAEEFGGDLQVVEVSGLTGLNMDKLEEEIVALAEVLDLTAQYDKTLVEGHVIESQVKKGAGNVATVLVTRGSLKNGTILVAGHTWCKVKSMKNEFNKPVKVVTPATPVEVYGWKELPEAGDLVLEVNKEAKAKSVVEYRIEKAHTETQLSELDKVNKSRLAQKREAEKQEKLKELLKYGLSPEDLKQEELELFGDRSKEDSGEEGKTKEVQFIVKADVSGSSEAIIESISHIGNEEVKPGILYDEVGAPTESDLDRAEAAGATIVCFNVNVPKDISVQAEKRNIKIVSFTVIYHLIEEVTSILSSHLKPIIETKILGEAEVRAIFSITNPKTKKKFKIAGSRVNSGVVQRASKVTVKRGDLIVFKGELNGIKRNKDDVGEIRKGSECGIEFKNWEDFQEGDVIEVYEEKEVPRYL